MSYNICEKCGGSWGMVGNAFYSCVCMRTATTFHGTVPAPVLFENKFCDFTKPGYFCSRLAGHNGPCAMTPTMDTLNAEYQHRLEHKALDEEIEDADLGLEPETPAFGWPAAAVSIAGLLALTWIAKAFLVALLAANGCRP